MFIFKGRKQVAAYKLGYQTEQGCLSKTILTHEVFPKLLYLLLSSKHVQMFIGADRELYYKLCAAVTAGFFLTKASNTRVSKVSLSEFSIMMLKRASRVSCRN